MSLLTVTFLSISVDLLIFIIFAFAYQMPDYDMSFLVEIVTAWLFDFIFNEVNTLFAKKEPWKESVFGIDMLTSLQIIEETFMDTF